MINDLNAVVADASVHADVCVIGSGPAGLTLARALTARGIAVVLLEAGPETAGVVGRPAGLSFDRTEYRGATLGRACGLGGTSAIWGGQLLPLRREEMLARPAVAAPAWPIDHQELQHHFATAEGWSGVEAGSFEVNASEPDGHPLRQLAWNGLSPRCSKWIAFRRRNLAKSWLPSIAATGKLQLWINATAHDFEVAPGNGTASITRVTARAPSGHALDVRAPAIVICAGALEAARLVLELAERCAATGQPGYALAGRYLQDHLSIRLAAVELVDRARFMTLFAPFFRGPTMRSLRIDLPPDAAARAGLPAAYAHFVVESPADSGFAALRDTLRSLQGGRPAEALAGGLRLLRALPEVAELAYWRAAHRRLISPANGKVFLQLDFEQPQSSANRVRLTDTRDTTGRRGLAIDWDAACDPGALVAHMTQELRAFWSRNALDEIARLEFLHRDGWTGSLAAKLYDIHHPAGTTRMAGEAGEGVVDPDLRIFGLTNCYIASTSVFPSLGAANPTLTLMALALRLSDHLTRRIRGY